MATKKTDSTEGGRQASGAQAGGAGRKAPSSAQTGASAAKGAAPRRAGAAPGGESGGGATAAKGAGSKGAASKGSASRGAAAKGAAAKGGAAKRAPVKRGGGAGGDLRSDVRSFAAGRPQGWDHDEWLGFLEDLRSRGHNVEDREAIGSMLERERLGLALEKVPGIGAQRVRAISERYGNIWRLKDTSADELERDAGIPRPLAERIVETVR